MFFNRFIESIAGFHCNAEAFDRRQICSLLALSSVEDLCKSNRLGSLYATRLISRVFKVNDQVNF
jgi:hypothetical protein